MGRRRPRICLRITSASRDEAQERAFRLKGKLTTAHSYIAILTFALVLLVSVVAVVQWFGIPLGVAPPAM